MKKTFVVMLALCGISLGTGCLNVKAPEQIHVGGGPPPQNVDSSRVPATHSHEEARAELARAYDQIRYLEHECERLRDRYEDAKADKEEYKRKYKDLKDKHDD
jgi:hypothetical protein